MLIVCENKGVPQKKKKGHLVKSKIYNNIFLLIFAYIFVHFLSF